MSLTELFIPFPSRLMSTARAPDRMPTEFARYVENMYTRLDGAGSKRNGFTTAGNAIGLTGGAYILRLFSYVDLLGVTQLLAQTSDGALYLQDSEGSWSQVYSGLTVGAPLRSAQLGGKMVLCNGVDDVLVWDGNTMAPAHQEIVDQGANLTYEAANRFSIDSGASFYAVGTLIKATLAGGDVTSTVASVTGVGTLTVTLNDAVLDNTLSAVAFTIKPPKFHYLYAAHDRLWGFGSGAIAPDNLGTAAERARVYYTDAVNDPEGWYDAEGVLQSINLADKMPAQDVLQAMVVKDGLTVFFSRTQTQVWAGTDPTLTGDMAWQKTIPIGVVHGDLVVNLPNDVGFFTAHGARTLSRLLQSEQLDVGDVGQEISPTLTTDVATVLADVDLYQRVQPFAFNAQDWFGFHINGAGRVFQLTNTGVGWTSFTGLFATATAFCNAADGTLYVASGDSVYQYDTMTYSDVGSAIRTVWWTPWLNVGEGFKRWANKGVSTIMEQGIAQTLKLMRYKDYDSSSFVRNDVSSTPIASYWDAATWDESYFDNAVPKPERVRDGFVADVFAYEVKSESVTGPLTVFGLKVDGVRER